MQRLAPRRRLQDKASGGLGGVWFTCPNGLRLVRSALGSDNVTTFLSGFRAMMLVTARALVAVAALSVDEVAWLATLVLVVDIAPACKPPRSQVKKVRQPRCARAPRKAVQKQLLAGKNVARGIVATAHDRCIVWWLAPRDMLHCHKAVLIGESVVAKHMLADLYVLDFLGQWLVLNPNQVSTRQTISSLTFHGQRHPSLVYECRSTQV
mmetsp:Transcript_63758/g.137172  ORF Transcript_63758/g.137172 Transcript_63758/m.137172 type:complete len:209 (+) Transcript_63758:61-687(+)